MMKPSERHKIFQAKPAVALNNTNTTGRYIGMKGFRRGCAILNAGVMAATKTSAISVYQATDGAGTGGKILGTAATITANTAVTEATLALSTVLNTHTVTINALAFTAHTDTTTLASRQFSIAGDDTADGDELVSCINDAVYGVPGVTASNNTGTVTLRTDGSVGLTITETGATITLATIGAQATVEFLDSDLDDGFTHVAAYIATTANSVVSAVMLLEPHDLPADQVVGASA